MSSPSKATNGAILLAGHPGLLLAGLTLGGWMAAAIWPRFLVTLGIADYGTVYLDSYAILAALDAVRNGADPHGANALDPLMRGHVYSDWWLGLRWLGLSRADNFLIGTSWVGAFGVTAWLTARARTTGEAVWVAALLVSPPVMLAIKRANNDLVIFVLLAGCGLAATAVSWGRTLFAVLCLGAVTGLKYFPAPAALVFLWSRPVKRMPAGLLLALLAVGLALASVWHEVDRGRFFVASGIYTMGAPLFWRDLGWSDQDSALPGLLVAAVSAALLAAGRITTGLSTQGGPAERMRAALGAIVVLTCFFAGLNYSYRWIFALWPASWLWRRGTDPTTALRQKVAARIACALVALCLWLDGLFCLIVNLCPPTFTKEQLDHVQHVWRLWTQPINWLLMLLLAGWLLEGALASLQAWWATRHEIQSE